MSNMKSHRAATDSGSTVHEGTNGLRGEESLELSDNHSRASRSVGTEYEVEVEYLTGIKLTVVILAVIAIALLVMLDMSIVATAVPNMTSDFHTTAGVGWYGTAYLLTSCSLQPMSGKLYTRFNLKYTYMAFIALFEVGSLICGVASSSDMFIIGRAIAGMGSAGVANGALTILCASVPLVKRPCSQIGVVTSPLLGGALTEYASWRWCFYINLPIGAMAVFALLFVSFPERTLQGPESRSGMNEKSLFSELDVVGFLLLVPTLVMFLLVIEWGGSTYPWSSATVIGPICGSAGGLVLFLTWEYKKGDSAMIPLRVIKQRVFYCSSLTCFFLYANSLVTSYYLAIYFQGVRGKPPMLSGVYMLPGVIAQMASGLLSGFAVTRIGYYLPPTVMGTMLCAVAAGLMSMLTPHTSFGAWVGFQILAGLGRGCSLQNPLIAVQNNLPPSKIAVSLAFLYFCQTFGGALWLSFASTLFNAGLTSLIPTYAPGVSVASAMSAGVSGIRSSVPHASVDGVVMAYNQAVQHVFYMVSGTATGAFIFSCGLGWKTVKRRTA